MSEKLTIPDRYLLLYSVSAVKNGPVRVAQMPMYGEAKLSAREANSVSWQEFKRVMQPFSCRTSNDSVTEFAFTHKGTPWTVEDVNVWVGSNETPINEISDFTPGALADLFKLHTAVAGEFLKEGKTTQWGFGFNPHDFSPGHHSVKRFHTHVRGLENPLDQQNVVRKSWRASNWFERLTAIEPFTPIAADVSAALLQLPQIKPLGWYAPDIKRSGYITYEATPISDFDSYAQAFRGLYEGGRIAYQAISGIFTDGSISDETDKYIPLPKQERLMRYEAFAKANDYGLSPQSLELLRYLASHIQAASARLDNGSVTITRSSQVHITQGFAGGFMFTTKNDGRLTVDFFPRVITTTGPTKNLHADGDFYGFTKTKDKPSDAMRQENAAFAEKIGLIVNGLEL